MLNDAVCVDLKVGTKPIGSGIILDDENNKGSYVLVTARHVVTINRDHLKNICLALPDNSKIPLGDSTRRWMTEDDENFDIALLKLRESELSSAQLRKCSGKLKLRFNKKSQFDREERLHLVNPRAESEAEYIKRQIITADFFPDNLYLKSASLDVGLIKMQIPKSMSGSPVICKNISALIGVAVISNFIPKETGFIEFERLLPLLRKAKRGDSVPLLADLKNLW